uniref:Uncharacterized protein n=1 Tax=Timema bartmani TaxID=61472 RepID=A0A7R9F0D4_9NEOP|nr:unnamed protein product [Timema bartmani]
MNSKIVFGLAVVLCSLQGIYGDNVTINSNYTTSTLALTAIEAYIEAAQAAAGEAMANFTVNMSNANANASALLSSGLATALKYAEAAVAQGKSAAATIEAAMANLTQEINNTVTNSSTYKALVEQEAILDGIAANITKGWASAIQLANSTTVSASKQGVAAVANLLTVGSNLSQIIMNGTEAAIAEGETKLKSAINSSTALFGDSANDTVSRFVSALSTAVNSGNQTASSIASVFQSGVSALQARFLNGASTLYASLASQLAAARNVTSTEFAMLGTAFTKIQSAGLEIGSAIVSTMQNDTAAVISEGESIASQNVRKVTVQRSTTYLIAVLPITDAGKVPHEPEDMSGHASSCHILKDVYRHVFRPRVDSQTTNTSAGVSGESVLGNNNVDYSERGDFTMKLKEGRQVAGQIASIAAVSLKDMMFRGSKAAKEWAIRAREKAEFAAETAFDHLVEFSGYTGDH